MPRSALRAFVFRGLTALAFTGEGAAPAAALAPTEARALADATVARSAPDLLALYKDLHQNPELAFQEARTASVLAARMRKLGFEVAERVGRTGVVAVLRNGAGPTVMIRTELDALPLEEKTGLPFASRAKQMLNGRETFVDHACGHDVHMAAWIGTAQALAGSRGRWKGTLLFVAQPAEEVLGGASAVLKDGLFTRFPKPDVGFAIHVGSGANDTVELKTGIMSSASDNLIVTFKGRGAHGSMPQSSIDPVVIASRFVLDVQTLVSREKDPAQFGVVTVGAFQAGTVGNIIPDLAVLRLTIRSYEPEVRKLLADGAARMARAAAAAANAPEPVIVNDHSTAAVNNDPALAERTGAALTAAFGGKAERTPAYGPAGSASEDYAYFVEAGVPSSYMSIGGYPRAKVEAAKASGERIPVNHSPFFAPDPEPSIKLGVEALTVAAFSALTPVR